MYHRFYIFSLIIVGVLSFNKYYRSSITYGLSTCNVLCMSTLSAPSTSSFKDIPEWLSSRCTQLGYIEPTEVQKIALPVILSGKDVVLQAQTGSGKTLAYCLPILANIDSSRASIQAVIIIPSRELGLQVSAVIRQLAAGSSKKILVMPLVEGSQNRRQQLWAIAEPPHIVVGTPSQVQKLVSSGRLKLNSVSYVILDEVDACLSNHNTKKDLHELLSRKLSSSYQSNDHVDEVGDKMTENLVYTNLAKNQRDIGASANSYSNTRQTIICSATINQRQHFLSSCYQNGWTQTVPELLHVSPSSLVPSQVDHDYVICDSSQKLSCLKYLIKKENEKFNARAQAQGDDAVLGNNDHMFFQAMVFVDDVTLIANIKDAVATLTTNADSDADVVACLTEDINIDNRANILKSFRDGACRILICSNIVARGIDVPSVSHIFQYNLPNNVDDYIHRSGRTGRNSKQGSVITIISQDEKFVIDRYSNAIGASITERKLKVVAKKKET